MTQRTHFRRSASAGLVAAAFGLACALPVAAADRANPNDNANRADARGAATAPAGQATQRSMRDVRVSKLIGMNVKNPQGENLGEIKDVIVDLNRERVAYAVLSFGGFMGLGDKLFAYPVNAFRIAGDKDELTLNVPKERLKDAPGFESNRWPDFNRDAYRGDVDRYWTEYGERGAVRRPSDRAAEGAPVQGAPAGESRLARASTFLDYDVKDANGKDVGDIEDAVVDLSSGRIHYVVVDFDKPWSLDDKLIPMPLRAFRRDVNRGDGLVVNVTREQLANAPSFEGNRWPDANDRGFHSRVDRWFGGLRTPAQTSAAEQR
jgi:sporulation protein YlmC with PRC-barrel domain